MTHPPPEPMRPMTLSEIEIAIKEFNDDARSLLAQRTSLVKHIEDAGLGKRFAQRSLASVIV